MAATPSTLIHRLVEEGEGRMRMRRVRVRMKGRVRGREDG